MTRENAELGVFLTLEEPSRPMRTEAAAAGTYTSPWNRQTYPKVQMLTIAELLADRHRPDPACLAVPHSGGTQHTLPEPAKHVGRKGRQGKLGLDGP